MTTEKSTPGGGSRTVELYVMAEVHEAARERASRTGQPLSAVARTVLWEAARNAPPSPPEGVKLPRNYLTGQGDLKRVRFAVPGDEYSVIAEQIRRAGNFPNFALEDGLEAYARSGKFYPDKEIRERNRRRRLRHDLGYLGRPRASRTNNK